MAKGFELGFAQNYGVGTSSSRMTEEEKEKLKAEKAAGKYEQETQFERELREGYEMGMSKKDAQSLVHPDKPLKGAHIREEGKAVTSRIRSLRAEANLKKQVAKQSKVKTETDELILGGKKDTPLYFERQAAVSIDKLETEERKASADADKARIEADRHESHLDLVDKNATTEARAKRVQAKAQLMAAKNADKALREEMRVTKEGEAKAATETKLIESIRARKAAISNLFVKPPKGKDPIAYLDEVQAEIFKMPDHAAGSVKASRASSDARSSLQETFDTWKQTVQEGERWKGAKTKENRMVWANQSIEETEGGAEAHKRAVEAGRGGESQMYHWMRKEAGAMGIPLNAQELAKIIVQQRSLTKPHHLDKDGVPFIHEGNPIENYEVDVAATKHQWELYKKNWSRTYGPVIAERTIKSDLVRGGGGGGLTFPTEGQDVSTKPTLVPNPVTKLTGPMGGVSPAASGVPLPISDPSAMQDLLDAIGDPRADINPFGTVIEMPAAEAAQADRAASQAWYKGRADRDAARMNAELVERRGRVDEAVRAFEATRWQQEPDIHSDNHRLRQAARDRMDAREAARPAAKAAMEKAEADYEDWHKRRFDPDSMGPELEGGTSKNLPVEKLPDEPAEPDVDMPPLPTGRAEPTEEEAHARKAYSMMREGVDYARDKSSGTVYIEEGLTLSIRESFLRKYKYNSTQDRGINKDPSKLINSRIGRRKRDLSSYKSQLKIIEDELKHGKSVSVGRSGQGKTRQASRKLTIPERTAYIKRRDQLKSKITDVSGTIPEMEADLKMLSNVRKLKGKTIGEEEARKLGIIK